MFYVYVLRSLTNGKLYTGYTGNIEKRLKNHNSGQGGRFTRLNKPFMLVYKEEFDNKYDAQKRERELKTGRGRYFVKKTIKKSGLVVDIDETLSWTLKYWFKELSRLFGNPENLTVVQLIDKYRYFQNVPYWQTPEVQAWVDNHIEDNELQKKLPLIKNSNRFLNKVNEIVKIKGYLTLRPTTVSEGTKYWLKRHGFPEGEIIAKQPEMTRDKGHEWKAKVLVDRYPEVFGIIDDNAVILNHLPENYPGVVLLYNMVNYETKRKNVYCCPSWRDVLICVNKLWGNEK